MSAAYRAPAREIDETEIERVKIHEAAETKREAIRQTEVSKRDARRLRNEWWAANGLGAFVVTIALIGGVTLASILIGGDYLERRYPESARPCVDRSTTAGGHCTHPEHALTPRPDRTTVCLCRGPGTKPAE